jgi:hypothetical protein
MTIRLDDLIRRAMKNILGQAIAVCWEKAWSY